MMFALSATVVALHARQEWPKLHLFPKLGWLALAAGTTNLCFNTGIALGDVVRVMLLFYLMPLWSALLARWILHEPITRIHLMEMLLGLSGAALVTYRPEHGFPWPQGLPDWLGLLGGISFAANNICLRKLRDVPGRLCAMTMLLAACGMSLIAALTLSLLGLISTPPSLNQAQWALLMMWALLLLLGNLCLQYGAARLPPGLTAVLMLAEVAVGAWSAWLLGASQLNWQELLGGALILSATVVGILGRRRGT